MQSCHCQPPLLVLLHLYNPSNILTSHLHTMWSCDRVAFPQQKGAGNSLSRRMQSQGSDSFRDAAGSLLCKCILQVHRDVMRFSWHFNGSLVAHSFEITGFET